MTGRTAARRSRLLAAVILTASAAPAGCTVAESRQPPSTVTMPAGPTSTSSGPGPAPPYEIRERSTAALVQICIDQSPEVTTANPRAGAAVLHGVVAAVQAHTNVSEMYGGGIAVQAFVADARAAESPTVLKYDLPDATKITLSATADAHLQRTERDTQAAERRRAASAAHGVSGLIALTDAIQLPPTTTADLIGCISRANRNAAGFEPRKRMLVIASSFSRNAQGDREVEGNLAGLSSLVLVEVGPDALLRRDAWAALWSDLKAGTTIPMPIVDVADGGLDDDIANLLAAAGYAS